MDSWSTNFRSPPENGGGNWYDPIFQRAAETFGKTPYSFGGDRTEGYSHGPWDCAGWISEVLDAHDPPLGNFGLGIAQMFINAERQRQACIPISEEEALPGDLVFFEGTYETVGASHVGLVWDPANHIMADDHQRGDGTGPGLTSWDDPYWRSHLMGFGRVKRPFEAAPAFDYWTLEEIGQAANVAAYPNVADNWPACVAAFEAWGIATPLVLIGLIGTIAKESGTFYPVREAWWVYDVNPATAYKYYADTSLHAAYDGGPDWHGRGYIQATHRATYQAFNDDMIHHFGRDTGVTASPDRMLHADVSAHFAAWFFLQKGLVPLCEARNWVEIRRRVWGAYGDANGVGKLQHAEAVLLPLAQARGFA